MVCVMNRQVVTAQDENRLQAWNVWIVVCWLVFVRRWGHSEGMLAVTTQCHLKALAPSWLFRMSFWLSPVSLKYVIKTTQPGFATLVLPPILIDIYRKEKQQTSDTTYNTFKKTGYLYLSITILRYFWCCDWGAENGHLFIGIVRPLRQ